VRILFIVAIFLSSALLFLVEPMVARIILPAYGGAASVWTASMLFFQAALLMGYGYAHLSTRHLGTRRQPWVHLGLMALILSTLPFASHVATGAIGASTPVFRLLGQLVLMVGGAFFIVSSGAPLLQRWFADGDDPHAKDPYFLYAASNLGSMVALLAYPVLVEPRLGLFSQTRLWTWGYAGLVGAMAVCAVALAASRRRIESSATCPEGASAPGEGLPAPAGYPGATTAPDVNSTATCPEGASVPSEGLPAPAGYPGASAARGFEPQRGSAGGRDNDVLVDTQNHEITNRQRAKWVVLAAVPSSLLLGVTAYISTNIAPIPLLWVIPLALYLLSFILAFRRRPILTSRPLGRIVGILIPAIMVAVIMEAFMPILSIFHLVVFLAVAWMCHARLVETRPPARHLTEFYFWMSVGGVIGGLFNALVAPFIFSTLFEYPLALIVAARLIPPYRPGSASNRIDWIYPLALTLVTAIVIVFAKLDMAASQVRTAVAVGLPAIFCYLAVDRPKRFALSIAGVVLIANGLAIAAEGNIVLSERSFFGVHRVTFSGPKDDPGRFHMLTHGNTKHGMQNVHDPGTPLMYYYPDSPIGTIFTRMFGKGVRANIGLVGLGVGSLAAYGQPGQNLVFYEIDPTVAKLATDPRLFTYVGDSRARGANVSIVLGDGRLELARSPAGGYGLIVLDAFSSDAIPIHMLTREAAAMYMSKLAPGGILAYHISNRYLDLSGVVAAIGRDLGLHSYIADYAPTFDEMDKGAMPCVWMVLARRPSDVTAIMGKASDWSDRPFEPGDRAWTDDYSNVLGVLKSENL
jgi:hypothetical protein